MPMVKRTYDVNNKLKKIRKGETDDYFEDTMEVKTDCENSEMEQDSEESEEDTDDEDWKADDSDEEDGDEEEWKEKEEERKIKEEIEDHIEEEEVNEENMETSEVQSDDVCDTSPILCHHCPESEFESFSELYRHGTEEHPLVCLICFDSFDNKQDLSNHQSEFSHILWHCDVCDKIFPHHSSYKKHLKCHEAAGEYKCPKCNKFKTFSETEIQAHMKHCHCRLRMGQLFASKVKLCCICYRSFVSEYSLIIHMLKNHNDRVQMYVYKCEICKLGFANIKRFKEHVDRLHGKEENYVFNVDSLMKAVIGRSNTCEKCDVSLSRRSLIRHLKAKHPELFAHKCDQCDLHFLEESDLEDHLKRSHGKFVMECPSCHKTFEKTHSFKNHLKRMHAYQLIPDFYCFTHEKSCMTAQIFYAHMERHHNHIRKSGSKKEFENGASMEISGRHNLKIHRRKQIVASDSSVYTCEVCGRKFDTKIALGGHVTVHNQTIECEVCSKKFSRYSALYQHSFLHVKREPFGCDICGCKFKRKSSLELHVVKHTDRFKCNVCSKTFETYSFLCRHTVVHTKEKPFKCEICGLRATQNAAIMRHKKNVHPHAVITETLC